MQPSPATLRALTALAPGAGEPTEPVEPTVLAHAAERTVIRAGRAVVKAHDPATGRDALARRVAVAAHPLLRGVLLPPLAPLALLPDGRPASVWPHGRPVDPEAPSAAPWEAAGRLLAGLHTVPVRDLPGPLPPTHGPAKAARALHRLRAVPLPSGLTAGVRAVERAWRGLPPWCRDEAAPPRSVLCHGDFHLGQLVAPPTPADGTGPRPWRLIDVDDLGLGDPGWDLARPAAWYAAGLLPAEAWEAFTGAYRDAGGPLGANPWDLLEPAARALTVQSAAQALVRAAREERAPDEAEHAVLEACSRIARLDAAASP